MAPERRHRLRADGRGESQALSELLLVGVVIVLTVVLATVVFGIGESVLSPAPALQLEADFDDRTGADDRLTLTHAGGAAVEADRLTVAFSTVALDGGRPVEATFTPTTGWRATTVTAGVSLTVADETDLVAADGRHPGCVGRCDGPYLDLDSARVRVVWSSPRGDTNATVFEWAGPEA